MITIIPIEPLNDEHGMLIVEAFNRFFIDRGGLKDGRGDGYGNGYGRGYGYGWGNGDGDGDGEPAPEEWQVK